jgi:hypothetical protein
MRSLLPMAHVHSVPRSIAFYEKRGFSVGNTFTPDDVAAKQAELERAGIAAGPIRFPFYAPRGEFRIEDPDGHVLMVTHT